MSTFRQPLAFRGQTVSKTGSVHEAAELGELELLQKHCDGGRELGYPDRETLRKKDDMLGAMPLHYAAENGHVEAVKWLVGKGVEVTAADSTGVTALHLACIKGNSAVVEFLLDHGCGTESKDCEGDTAMHWAATKGHVGILQLLQKFGAQLEVPNNSGWTALHRAAYCGGGAACEWLMENGVSINAVNRDGNTPLHLACQCNQLTCINVLLQWGAKPDLPNKDGFAPVDMGSTEGVVKVMEEFAPGTPKRRSAPAKAALAGNSKRWSGYLRKDISPGEKLAIRPPPVARTMEDGFPGAMDSPLRIDKPTIFEEDDPDSPSLFSYINTSSPLGLGPGPLLNEPPIMEPSPLSRTQTAPAGTSPQVPAVTQAFKKLDVKRSPRTTADTKVTPRRTAAGRRATGEPVVVSPTASSRSSRQSSVAPWDEDPPKADPITRRASANQKFLGKYNLDKAKLFSS
ncbi:hypothetical protein WJX72_012404 [[Myrmecia] bisecta]|uniref:Uncharacterized protein n=1 Tax=[Myrmecia] bisecta TaxID=41462 RepID=A0AAW1PD91_9CHLO